MKPRRADQEKSPRLTLERDPETRPDKGSMNAEFQREQTGALEADPYKRIRDKGETLSPLQCRFVETKKQCRPQPDSEIYVQRSSR